MEEEKKKVELQPQKEAEVPEGGQKSGASNTSFSALAVCCAVLHGGS